MAAADSGRHRGCPPSYDEATFALLTQWRLREADERGLPAFCVFTDATLMAIAEDRPADAPALLSIPGVGRTKAEQYGEAILALLAGEDGAD